MTERQPVSAWLRARTPAPPPQLVARIEAMAAGIADRDASADVFLSAAEAAMRGLLSDGCLTRQSALDLLAVDALVTYAFEAAADEPASIDERAAGALSRISALAAPFQA